MNAKKGMNTKAINSPEYPDWMKWLKPTDIKWLNEDRTAALCVFNDSRCKIMVVCKDEMTKGNRCIEVTSAEDEKMSLEKVGIVFDNFQLSKETDSMSPAEIAECIRNQIASPLYWKRINDKLIA